MPGCGAQVWPASCRGPGLRCCSPSLGNCAFLTQSQWQPACLQIPALVRMTQQALEEGKCVVVGLQSTGEARTADVVAEKGEDLEDFVSGPRVSHCRCCGQLALT